MSGNTVPIIILVAVVIFVIARLFLRKRR